MTAIEVRGLTKRYGSTVAVNEVSFSVQAGRVTGFLGPNGAGKSTTMRMIMGLDHPTSGSVLVNGQPYVQLHRPLREIGALLDAAARHGGRSAYYHLLSLAQSNGIPSSRVTEVLDTVGLATVARRRAGRFSLGMGQRLGIAAALLGDPRILMFDEPVNGLDPEGILWIRELMRSLAAEGRAVFVSSHLMSEMAQTADHLIVIGRGRLLADTGMTEFLHQADGSHVRVRSPQLTQLATLLSERGVQQRLVDDHLQVMGCSAAEVGDLAAAHGVPIHELVSQGATLETAYMNLTRDSVEFRTGGAAVPAGR